MAREYKNYGGNADFRAADSRSFLLLPDQRKCMVTMDHKVTSGQHLCVPGPQPGFVANAMYIVVSDSNNNFPVWPGLAEL